MNGVEYLYGYQPVRAALTCAIRNMHQILIYESAGASNSPNTELVSLAKTKGIRIQYATRIQLDQLSQGRPHQNIILQTEPLSIGGITFAPRAPQKGTLTVMLDDVVDPQNVGSILRTCAFFGVQHIWLTKGCTSLSPTVSKASAGSLEFISNRVKLIRKNPVDLLAAAQRQGYRLLVASALDLTEGSPIKPDPPNGSSSEVSLPILIFGNEGSGVRGRIQEIADSFISVKREHDINGLDSLNVSVAAALLISKLRQSEILVTTSRC